MFMYKEAKEKTERKEGESIRNYYKRVERKRKELVNDKLLTIWAIISVIGTIVISVYGYDTQKITKVSFQNGYHYHKYSETKYYCNKCEEMVLND